MHSPYFTALAKLMDSQGLREFTVTNEEIASMEGEIIVTWSHEKLSYIITRHKNEPLQK